MSKKTDNYFPLLEPYGFSREETDIYLDLLSNPTSSALEISRRTGIPRTRVYRILDSLIAKEMVVQSLDDRGFKFVASTPDKLGQLLREREGELEKLQRGLPDVVEALERISGFSRSDSKVLYYSGEKGLDRVNFNVLRARGELLSFEIETANAFLDTQRAEYMRRRTVEEGIKIRTITNAVHLPPFTRVKKLVTDFWEIRHIPTSDFEIKLEMFVYNDVYLIYHYTNNDVFCIEIYNQSLADMQKQLFEYLWKRSIKMRKIGDQGEVRI